MTGKTISHYRIQEKLGGGGMGVVYKAQDTKLKRTVALKVLPPDRVADPNRKRRFIQEARAASALNHPNIITIYDIDEAEGVHFIAMEYVAGKTLDRLIARRGLPVNEALKYAVQMAAALAKAHAAGIVHRDLKPTNVMVTDEGLVKVLDFGLAKLTEAATGGEGETVATLEPRTEEGTIVGTVGYMSPEQAKGKTVDNGTDIWAFGCILYECLTGQPAFKRETNSETLASILKDEPDWTVLPGNVPGQIRSLLHRCLQKDPSFRLQDIGDGRIEIQEFLAAPVEAATVKKRAPLMRLFWQRFPWIMALLMGIVAMVALWHPLTKEPASVLAPRRFVIIPPASKELDYYNTSAGLSLSPDGMHLAFSCEGGLFLRSMEELEAKPLAAGTHPFFSPDGKWIGFFAGQQIRKISILGGSPQVICNIKGQMTQGGSWGTDDTIIFSETGSLWQVRASGGEPEKLIPTKDHPNEEQGDYCWPHHLADGKAILFTIIKSPQDMRIALLNLETRKEQVLIDKGTKPHYIPTGHLVYSWENDILAARFDIAHFKVIGPSIPITQDVLAPLWYGQALFSVSETGTLAYVPETTAGSMTLAWMEQSGKMEPLPLQPARYGCPRISPDGKRILFTRLDRKNKIWIYDLERQTLRRLMDEDGDEWLPVWTPDGERVAFNSTRQGSVQGRMYWKSVEGDEPPERLVEEENWPCPHSFSPDGKLLAFRMISEETGYDIWMLPMDGKKKPWAYLQTKAFESWPKFSPNGKWISYVSDESGQLEVYVRPSQPSIRIHQQVSNDGGQEPLWSPDGREVYYMKQNKIVAVPFQGEPSLKVGKPRTVLEGDFLFIPGHDYLGGYDISPDGRRFLVVTGGEPKTMTVVLNWFEELRRKVPTGK
jgi:serine/threonine-protein kinase